MAQVVELGGYCAASLTVTKDSTGGVTGLSPTLAVQDLSDGKYIDWNDGTFKSSGWTTKYRTIDEQERGHYCFQFAVNSPPVTVGRAYSLQYRATLPTGEIGESSDVLLVAPSSSDISDDTTLLRKALTNKLVEAAGNPGTLTLYDDDNSTVLKTWTLLDANGSAVTETTGTPAQRSAAT